MENKEELAKTEASSMTKFRNLLSQETIKNKFNEALGKKGPLFMSNLVTIMSGSVELQKCEPMSVISSALMAASMDLSITSGLGFAGIVPYWDTPSGTMRAQFQVMKKGYIQLAQRTGLFKTIHVCDVFEGELKSYNKFTGEYVFDEAGKKSEKIVGYVSYFKLINGFDKYYYMPIEKLDSHARKYSKSFQKGKGKWADKEQGGYEQMCEKTVLKLNLSTYAPLSVDINMMNAIVYDQAEIRDLDAKDFNYMDNEESHQPEPKDIINTPSGANVVINQTHEAKSANMTSRAVDKIEKNFAPIDKKNEHIQEAIVVPETKEDAPIIPQRGSVEMMNGEVINREESSSEVAEEPVQEGQWSLKDMEAMPTEKLLAKVNDDMDMMEASQIIPGKNTNKKLREIIWAHQKGELSKLVAPHIQAVERAQNNADASEGGVDPSEITVNKDFDNQGEKGTAIQRNIDLLEPPAKKEPENEHGIIIPPFDKSDQEREFSSVKKLFNELASVGIDNVRWLALNTRLHGAVSKWRSKEEFCKYATGEEIIQFLDSNTK